MTEFEQHKQPLELRLAAIGADGYVSADEVLYMRRSVFADGVVSPSELDALFDLGDRAPEGDIEWPQFFAEVVADFYLREETPEGYLTEEEFASLRTRMTRDGYANGLERMLLIKLMETALKTPPEMSGFSGEQIKAAILAKNPPAVDKSDVMMLRRWLFAAGGDANVAVSRAEAELLFDINDAVQHEANNPEWAELFVQGVINHLKASLGYRPVSRDEAFRRHSWLSDQSVNVGGFFQRMSASIFDAFRIAGAKEPSAHEQRAAERDAIVADAERVTPEEAAWLASRIGADGRFDPREQALIKRMRELGAALPDALKSIVERAA